MNAEEYLELKKLILNLEKKVDFNQDTVVKQNQENYEKIAKKIDETSCDDKLVTKEEAAKVISCEEQMIKKLEHEGRITNYGRGRFLRYRRSELLDVREVRNG